MLTMMQCTLEKDGFKQVAWIDTRAAVEGNMVELKEDGLFWKVGHVANNVTLPYAEVNERSQDYKRTRHASDI